MKVELSPGDKLVVVLENSDGMFTITWGEHALTVESDLPDQTGREGIIYEEVWGPGHADDDVADELEVQAPANDQLRSLTEGQRKSLYEILCGHAGVPLQNVSPTTTWLDLELDSLDLIDISMSIEDEFGISFLTDFAWSTVGQLEQAVAVNLQNATR